MNKVKAHALISKIVDDSNLLKNIAPFDQSTFYQSLITLSANLYNAHTKKFMSEEACVGCLIKVLITLMIKSGIEVQPSPNFDKLFNETNKDTIKDAVVKYFTSLPKVYYVHFNLPNVIYSKELNIQINDKITLKFENLKTSTPSIFNIFVNKTKSEPSSEIEKKYFLTVRVKHVGYLSYSDLEEPFSIFKQAIYLGLCRNLFSINPDLVPRPNSDLLSQSQGVLSYLTLGLDPASNYFTENKHKQKTNIALPKNENDFVFQIEMNSQIKTHSLEGDVRSYTNLFTQLTTKHLKKHKTKILSGLEWAFASAVQHNETFKFILKCIAIEALIGDTDSEGSTNRLLNRCAYQLAKNHTERDEILLKFPKLYKLRSKLVHGNQAQLQPSEKDQLSFADFLLSRIFLSELEMLGSE